MGCNNSLWSRRQRLLRQLQNRRQRTRLRRHPRRKSRSKSEANTELLAWCLFFSSHSRRPRFSGASDAAHAAHNKCLCLAAVVSDQEGCTMPLQLPFLASSAPATERRAIDYLVLVRPQRDFYCVCLFVQLSHHCFHLVFLSSLIRAAAIMLLQPVGIVAVGSSRTDPHTARQRHAPKRCRASVPPRAAARAAEASCRSYSHMCWVTRVGQAEAKTRRPSCRSRGREFLAAPRRRLAASCQARSWPVLDQSSPPKG